MPYSDEELQWLNQAEAVLNTPPAPPGLDSYFALKTAARRKPINIIPEKDMPALPARKGFKFGCDPELFVKDPDGRYVTAEGLIEGTKEEPFKVKKGAYQVDGMAAEFNIEPADTFEDWNGNIAAVMQQLENALPKGYTLDAVPAVRFDEDVFTSAPDKAKMLGCQPDFNAWTGNLNPPPNDPDDPFLRTASGHIHIGWTEDADVTDLQHLINCQDLVKQFDWYLGGWSLQYDSDPTRRNLYGKAGACRYKPYGVEYRVLSNFWITTKEMRLMVWNRMQTAIAAMQESFMPDRAPAIYSTLLVDAINSSKLSPDLQMSAKYPLTSLSEAHRRF